MAFVQQLECDQIEEPSILWKLPLLLLSAVVKQSDHQLLLADDLLSNFRNYNYTDEDCYNKWKPSLPTIEEEEKVQDHIRTEASVSNIINNNNNEKQKTKSSTTMWQAALSSAGAILPSKQKRVLLGIFVSCCSPFVPVALW